MGDMPHFTIIRLNLPPELADNLTGPHLADFTA
jgi:hypothetical protein